MPKGNRFESVLVDGHDIPDDLPAPSTSRPLLSRSRAASLARSQSASRHGSRGSSRSNSSHRSSAMLENMTDTNMAVFPDPTVSSSLNFDQDTEVGGSLSTSSLKRKRSDPEGMVQHEGFPTMLGVFLFLLPNSLCLTW